VSSFRCLCVYCMWDWQAWVFTIFSAFQGSDSSLVMEVLFSLVFATVSTIMSWRGWYRSVYYAFRFACSILKCTYPPTHTRTTRITYTHAHTHTHIVTRLPVQANKFLAKMTKIIASPQLCMHSKLPMGNHSKSGNCLETLQNVTVL